MRLVYGFETPKQTKVYEEYIIMDGMSMIGVVGGTFGLFIGFSFIGIIEYIFSLFRKSYKVCWFEYQILNLGGMTWFTMCKDSLYLINVQ